MEKMKKSRVPHTFVLIFGIIIAVAILTYIIPSGEYDRMEDPESGVEIIDPDSFTIIDQTPVPITAIFTSIPEGMAEVGWIIFLIFIIGGAFGIINGTGAVETGISKLVFKLQNREKIMIFGTLLLFSLAGATFGFVESSLIFIPMGIVLARGMKMDRVVGMAIVYVGAIAGFTAGFLNPFNVGVAQGIAGLPIFSGMVFRIIIQLIMVTIAGLYIIRYANRTRKDPTKSLVYDLPDTDSEQGALEDTTFTTRHKLVTVTVIIGFAFIIYGVFQGLDSAISLPSIFLATGIVAGLVGGITPNDIAEKFVLGAKELTYGALIVGLARAIVVILENGQIIDTIIYGSSQMLSFLPALLSASGMFVFQLFVNFFINSGSGQAATTIPIMAPLGDLLGVTRQTSVLAFQLGDGITNIIFPTSAILMAGLGMAKIPYERWVKWVLPLVLWWVAAGIIFTFIAVLINYGPF